jgi:hypothetical protein
MATGYMDSAKLLESIKLRAAIPMSQVTFSDSDLLNLANEELELKIIPSVLAVKEEFYVTLSTIPLVANQDDYTIPYRAIGNKVRSVFYEQSTGNLMKLANIPMEHLNEYQYSNGGTLAGFVLENDHLKIVPSVGSNPTGSLSLRYYLKPNAIVEMSRGAKIRSIDRTTGIIEVSNGDTDADTVPSNINVNVQVDFIRAKPINRTYSFDIDLVSVNATAGTITVDPDDIPAGLEVNDWVCTAGETVIPQIPAELHSMLAQAVACRVLESLTDTQALTNATAKLQEMEQKLLSVIDTRVESPFRKVVSPISLLNNGRFRRRFY